MSSPTDPGAPSAQAVHRTGLLTRLWQSLAGGPPEPPPAPPLFRPRPVPPPEPRGPGLPPLDDILLTAPPAPDPARAPRLVVVAAPPAAPPLSLPTFAPAGPVARQPPAGPKPMVAEPEVAESAAAAPASPVPVRPPRGLTPIERQAADRIRALVGAGLIGEAMALLDAHFRDQPDLRDRAGLPIYLVESFRCAAALDRREDMRRWEAALRPLLADSDPLLDAIVARAAVRRRDVAGARAGWLAALARAPEFAEARDWLARNPVAPDGGVLASELISGPRPLLQPAPPPAAAAPLPDALPAGAPGQWLRRVAIRVGETGPSVDGDWADARDIAGATESDVAAVLCNPTDIARPHTFAETALALLALMRSCDPPLRLARLYAGREPWATRASPSPQAEMLAVLFPGLRVVAAFDGAVRESTVLTLDGTARDKGTGTLIGCMMKLLPRATAEARARVFAAFGLPGTERPPRVPGRKPQALYLVATPSRALADPVRERLLALLERASFEVTTLDMPTLPWREQVRAVCGADLIFGVHGPWMSPVVWAHPQSRVLELFPPGAHRYDTHVLAQAAGLAYLGVEGLAKDGFVTQASHRIGPPAGNPGGIVAALPWQLLERALATNVK